MPHSSPVEAADFDALLELLDADTMREVVHMFAASAPERLLTAERGLADGNAAVVATAFHTLRSGCGQLGARHLEELCANAERLAKHGDLGASRDQLLAVRSELDRCLGWFRERAWLEA
jgi:HPt (histidine-containing phosphotransfer) domain-containing protein